jgi:hypothetical protein
MLPKRLPRNGGTAIDVVPACVWGRACVDEFNPTARQIQEWKYQERVTRSNEIRAKPVLVRLHFCDVRLAPRGRGG